MDDPNLDFDHAFKRAGEIRKESVALDRANGKKPNWVAEALGLAQAACALALQNSARVKRLEAQLANGGARSLVDSYRGTWKSGAHYKRGELLTHGGSLWFVHADTDEQPGKSAAYQLCVKSGAR